jgi:hypothetical protein
MKINLENARANQKNLDFHPNFWGNPETEILEILKECATNWTEYIAENEQKADCYKWVSIFKEYLQIVTAS